MLKCEKCGEKVSSETLVTKDKKVYSWGKEETTV